MSKNLLRKVSIMLLVVFICPSLSFGASNSYDKIIDTVQYNEVLKAGILPDGSKGTKNKQSGASSVLNSGGNLTEDIQETRKVRPGQSILASDLESYFDSLEKYFKLGGTEEAAAPLHQFGYAIFEKSFNPEKSFNSGNLFNSGSLFNSGGASFTEQDQLVSVDYVIGPGDSFTITMWGIAEGIFNVKVNSEGKIVLPKIGVVPVAGLRYGELEKFIEKELNKYYSQANVSVSMNNITGVRIYVVGEVNSPGTFNVSSLSTVYNALFMAGGPTKRGTLRDIRVIRNGKTIANVDLYSFLLYGDRKKDISLVSGDTIFVPVIGQVVAVSGNVKRPGIFEMKKATDLRDAINMAGGILPTSYVNRVQIRRIEAHEKRIVLDKQFSFSKENPRFYVGIQDMDLIKVFSISSDINNVVYLDGAVKYPGPYQWRKDMTIKDLLISSNNLLVGADTTRGEIVRLDETSLKRFVLTFDPGKVFSGDNTQNYALQPQDQIRIGSELRAPETINLVGEVKKPGTYTIVDGERLSSVLARAGGFTGDAYLFGATFKRKSAKDAQAAAFKEMVDKMEMDLILREKNLGGPGTAAETIALSQQEAQKNREMLDKLRENLLPVGRVIIALKDPSLLEGTKDDIELEDGDELVVSKTPNIVNVLGEVYSPNSVVFVNGRKASYYLGMVGGPTTQADKGEIYVIRADGSIVSRKQGYDVASVVLLPGDTVLVPKSFDRFDFWNAFKDFTHWFYEATLAFAVIATYIRK